MKLPNFFKRGISSAMGRDVKVAMINAASQGVLLYDDVAFPFDDMIERFIEIK